MRLREVWPDLNHSMDCVSVLAVLLVNINFKRSNYVLNVNMVRHDTPRNSLRWILKLIEVLNIF